MTERVFLSATSGSTCERYARVVAREGASGVAREGASGVAREGASDVTVSLAMRGGWGFLSTRPQLTFALVCCVACSRSSFASWQWDTVSNQQSHDDFPSIGDVDYSVGEGAFC